MQAESVSGSLHLGDQVPDGLDALHLLSEVLRLESGLHGFKWSSPFHGGRLGDVLEDNSSATLGLVFHQLHAVGTLLAGLRLEVSSKSMEGLVIPVEVRTHGKIDVRGIEFHVDLLVDQRLAVLVVVLPDL